MAEYAGNRRCVRAAAQGFSPEQRRGMPREKASVCCSFAIWLENGVFFLQRTKEQSSQIIPPAFRWQAFQHPQKRKFFAKKRKKSRHFPYKVFCDCILRTIAVLYYGVFDPLIWMKKEEIR